MQFLASVITVIALTVGVVRIFDLAFSKSAKPRQTYSRVRQDTSAADDDSIEMMYNRQLP